MEPRIIFVAIGAPDARLRVIIFCVRGVVRQGNGTGMLCLVIKELSDLLAWGGNADAKWDGADTR